MRGKFRTQVFLTKSIIVTAICFLFFFHFIAADASEARQGGRPDPGHTNELVQYNLEALQPQISEGVSPLHQYAEAVIKILINTSGHGPITGIDPVAEKDYWLQLIVQKGQNYEVDWYDGIPNYGEGADGDLSNYDLVIYDAGGYWYPLSDEVAPLTKYHKSGRPLIVVAPDVNFDWNNIKSGSKPNFCENVLHIGGVRGTMPQDNYVIIANTGHAIISEMATGTEIPVAQQSSYPDCFDPLNDAKGVLRQGQSTIEFDRGTIADDPAAYSFGAYGNLYGVTAYGGSESEGRVVLFGFPPTAIQNSALLDQLCSNAIDFSLGQVKQSKKVKLQNMYVDDAGDKDVLVNKAKGDLLEVVHVISNEENKDHILTLTITVPEDWNFEKWFKRDNSAGKNNKDKQTNYKDLGNGKWEIQVGTLVSNKTKQVGVRFQIPESTSFSDKDISTKISLENGIPLIGSLATKVSIVNTAQAIIVTNRHKFYDIYGDANNNTTDLLETLFDIADGNEEGEVKSVVYYADWYNDDIKNWNNQDDNLYDGTPNDVADDLYSLIKGWSDNLFIACPQYIMIVGADEILPFYRVEDPTLRFSQEEEYTSLRVTRNNYYFSDTRYADLENEDFMEGELEAEIGRIVGAKVEDMKKLILKGIAGPQGNDSVVVASTADPCFDTNGAYDKFNAAGFELLNEGEYNDTIENNNWDGTDFIEAVNQGVKYVVEFTHASHISFTPESGLRVRAYELKGIDQLNDDEGFFVGLGGCHAGAIEDKAVTNSYTSSLAYMFINRGACGFFGSSAYVAGNILNNFSPWGEGLFNSFYSEIDSTRSIGTSYLLTLKNYGAGLIWSDSDKKAVTQFNLFAVPWMRPNLPDADIGEASFVSINDQDYVIDSFRPERMNTDKALLSGIFSSSFIKNYTFAVTSYNITQEGAFDLVNITGAEFDYNPFEPVLPKLMTILNLPKDSSVIAVQLVDGNTLSLGTLNIPNSQPSTSTNPLPPFTEYTEVTGWYPETNYGYDIDHYEDHVEIKIYFMPVQHNVDTDETTLWDTATIEVQYGVDENIFVSNFSSSQSEYTTVEDISTTTTIENAGSEAATGLTAVLTIKDAQGYALDSAQTTVGTVPAGGSLDAAVNISNGLASGNYLLIIEIKDVTDSTVAVSSQYIKIISEFIADFDVPEVSPNTGVDIPFAVAFQNHNAYAIDVDVQIKVYNNQNEKVATLISPTTTVSAGSLEDITVYWNSLNKSPGVYNAVATVNVAGKTYSAQSQFYITGPGIAAPNGGEILSSGSTYTIRWWAPLKAVQFNLQYSENNGETWLPIVDGITDTSYDWTVPTPSKNRTKCLVKVKGFNDNSKKVWIGKSAAPFKIEILCVTSPNGAEVLASGGTYDVSWETNGTKNPVEYVEIYCSKNNGKTWKLMATESGDPGVSSCVFPIVKKNENDCLVKVIAYDAVDKKIAYDKSDAPFTIEVVTITSPNGGETLTSGTTHNITWDTYETKKEIAKEVLKFTKNGGRTWEKITTIKGENPGTYLWTVPDVPKAKNKCKVKIQLKNINGKSLGADASDSYFRIEP